MKILYSLLYSGTSEDDYDTEEKDSHLMPPPSWLPSTSKSGEVKVKGEDEGQTLELKVSQAGPSGSPGTTMGSVVSEGERLNTPLAAMMPPELKNVDVTTIFPEFRSGKVIQR